MQDPCTTIDTKVGKTEYKFWNVDFLKELNIK